MKKILTTFETARFLGVSPYTIRLWVIKGLLPAFTTPGGHRRIKVEELDDFLKKNNIPISGEYYEGKWRTVITGFSTDKDELLRIREGLKGFHCAIADSEVEEGFMLLKIQPQILIVNLDNKKVSWRETAKIIRHNSELSHIHMLGVSGKVGRALVLEAEKLGFYNILSKPVSPEELRNCLKEIFGTLRF
jgi:excisionase family DNA binding protein